VRTTLLRARGCFLFTQKRFNEDGIMSHVLCDDTTAGSEQALPSCATRLPVILCIDDDPAVCRSLKIQLQNYAVDVLTATYGTCGYWETLVRLPDVIITDLRMPQGSGDYVVECLKRNPATRDIPILVLTGRRDPELQRYLYGLGIVKYFLKPLPFEDLREELSRHIALLPWDET
jgi:CheY-like chemotaxis protein